MYRTMRLLEMEIVYFMVSIYCPIPFHAFQNIHISAIVDGILYNEAFKHISNEVNNETWTSLLQDLRLFEEGENQLMFLRRRFVLGASKYLSGAFGSKQNDKQLFEYTDQEWEYIWKTMLEDGAWAVPQS